MCLFINLDVQPTIKVDITKPLIEWSENCEKLTEKPIPCEFPDDLFRKFNSNPTASTYSIVQGTSTISTSTSTTSTSTTTTL